MLLVSVCSSFKGSEAAKTSVENSTSNGDKLRDEADHDQLKKDLQLSN